METQITQLPTEFAPAARADGEELQRHIAIASRIPRLNELYDAVADIVVILNRASADHLCQQKRQSVADDTRRVLVGLYQLDVLGTRAFLTPAFRVGHPLRSMLLLAPSELANHASLMSGARRSTLAICVTSSWVAHCHADPAPTIGRTCPMSTLASPIPAAFSPSFLAYRILVRWDEAAWWPP